MSCLLLAIIRTYEAVTGIRSKSATCETGSSNAPDNRVLTMYRTSITVIGTISEKIRNQVESLGKDRKFVFLTNIQSKDYKR